MPLGNQVFNPNAAKPTVRKAKVRNGFTGQVLQEAGPYSADEAGKLQEANRRAMTTFAGGAGGGPAVGGIGGGTGMVRGRPTFGGGGSRGPSRWRDTWTTGGDGERVAFGLTGRERSSGGGGGGGGGSTFMRGPVRSAVSTEQGAQGTGSGGGGSPAFGFAPRPQQRSYSDRDGTTVAPQVGGGGLDEDFYQNNRDNPAAQAMRPAGLPPLEDPLDNAMAGMDGVGAGMGKLPWHAEGTDGEPVPLDQPFIAGDPQKNGKPNPELIWIDEEGVHVLPLQDVGVSMDDLDNLDTEDLPKLADGNLGKGQGAQGKGNAGATFSKRTPRGDGREIATKPAPKPASGLDADFYSRNPNTPTAAARETMKVFSHPGTAIKHPVEALKPLPRKAYGTVEDFGSLQRLFEMPGFDAVPADRAAFDAQGNLVGVITGLPEDHAAPGMVVDGAVGSTRPEADRSVRAPVSAPGEGEVLAETARREFEAGNLDEVDFNDGMNYLKTAGDDAGKVDMVRQAFSKTWQQRQRDKQEAAERAANPEGVKFGRDVTPRPALRTFAPQTVSAEDRQAARMRKVITRHARENPHFAFQLMAGRAAAAQAAAKNAWDRQKWQTEEQRLRATADETARHNAAVEKRNLDNDAIDLNFKVGEFGMKMSDHAQSFTPGLVTFQKAPGSRSGVVYAGGKPMGTALSDDDEFDLKRLKGTNEFYRDVSGKPDYKQPYELIDDGAEIEVPPMELDVPSVNLPWMGSTPAVKGKTPTMKVPARDPRFAPVAKDADRGKQNKDRIALLTSLAKLDEMSSKGGLSTETAGRIEKLRTDLLADFDGDGVPDALETGDGGAAKGAATAGKRVSRVGGLKQAAGI